MATLNYFQLKKYTPFWLNSLWEFSKRMIICSLFREVFKTMIKFWVAISIGNGEFLTRIMILSWTRVYKRIFRQTKIIKILTTGAKENYHVSTYKKHFFLFCISQSRKKPSFKQTSFWKLIRVTQVRSRIFEFTKTNPHIHFWILSSKWNSENGFKSKTPNMVHSRDPEDFKGKNFQAYFRNK